MSISTFNFQFYNYKLNPQSPVLSTSSGFSSGSRSSNSFISELEMDIDGEMTTAAMTSTPKPRFKTQLALELRPKLHTTQKRWSMELREKVLEMSKRNNGSDGEAPKPQATVQQQEPQQESNPAATPTVSEKINFFNRLTNTFQSSNKFLAPGNRFISMLRSSRPQAVATTGSSSNNSSLSSSLSTSQVPPPKPKRLGTTFTGSTSQFATPMGGGPRKCSLRRKPSMDKSRATIARQNSGASMRPQHHAIMEDLSLVVPVRLRIAEYEQRISMSA